MEQRSCTADEAEERPASSTPAPGSAVGSAGAGPGSVAGSQHYSLRWNNHQHHLLNAFELLLQNESLVDCTIMCEDAGLRAHRVVLSACSPYFQKIFIENPGKHPIIVLKDVYCWEMQSILDFMYKGETSVPEAQLTCLIKTAESLKIRGLTSSDQLPHGASLTSSPTNLSTGYRGYSPSPSPHHHHHRYSDSSKLTQLSSSHGLRSNESSPLSLTHVDQLSDRASGRASPVPSSNCPRRKQARPRRRSGDSINSSLDLSKPGSPPLSYSGGSHGEGTGRSSGKHGDSPNNMSSMDDTGPENLSLKRSSSPGAPGPHSHHNPHHPPAINLVKMEQLVDSDRSNRMDMVEAPECKDRDDIKHFSENGMKHAQEQEALQALNFMANSGGIPSHMIPPGGHHGLHHGLPQPHFPPLSTGSSKGSHSTGSQYGSGGVSSKPGLEYQRISIDRSKLSEDEAFEHAIDMISSRQMGFRKAADFFQVSKWKLYKTARKRGIYAEIKKQNQAHALSKVPSNVQHFAELGVYKQSRKREDKDVYTGVHRSTNPILTPAQYKSFPISACEPPPLRPTNGHHNLPPPPPTNLGRDYPPHPPHPREHPHYHQLSAPQMPTHHHRIPASSITNNNNINNNNNNNNIPLKMSFEKRGDPSAAGIVHHIKLEANGVHGGINGPPASMMQPRMVAPSPVNGGADLPPPLPGQNGHGGDGGYYGKYHDQPMQLTTHRYSLDHQEIDDDEDERMLVIAHKEPGKDEVYPAR